MLVIGERKSALGFVALVATDAVALEDRRYLIAKKGIVAGACHDRHDEQAEQRQAKAVHPPSITPERWGAKALSRLSKLA
jgi:hypothetical protein